MAYNLSDNKSKTSNSSVHSNSIWYLALSSSNSSEVWRGHNEIIYGHRPGPEFCGWGTVYPVPFELNIAIYFHFGLTFSSVYLYMFDLILWQTKIYCTVITWLLTEATFFFYKQTWSGTFEPASSINKHKHWAVG